MLSLDGRVEVNCTLGEAWALFQRFGEVAALIPTVEQVEVDGDRVLARVAVRMGALTVRSRVALEVVERKAHACIKAVGLSYLGETFTEQLSARRIEGVGADSVGRLSLHLDLRPEGERVAVVYHAEVEAEGRLKRIYQSILKTRAPAMMDQFAQNLKSALERPRAVAIVPAAAPARVGLWARFLEWLRGRFRRLREST